MFKKEREVIPLKELSEKHKKFVAEYVKDFNGTRAYQAVYPNCTAETARKNAYKLLTNADIQKAVNIKANKHLEKIDIDAEYIIRNIVEITERCMKHEPVMEYDPKAREYVQKTEELFDADGNPAGEQYPRPGRRHRRRI